jgi:Fe2+ transport system protein FeoA
MSLARDPPVGRCCGVKPDRLAWESAVSGCDAPSGVAGGGRRCVLCPLSDLERGACARVVSLAGAPRLRRKLMALGLRPSADLAVLGRAPRHGAMELRAGTVHLMLRADEARDVLVELAPAGPGARHELPVL